MSQNDTTRWMRSTKLAAVAGIIALCLFGGALLLNGGPRFFGWGLAAGLAVSAVSTLVNGYMRRNRLDTSRAAIDAKARRVRAFTMAGIVIGSFAAFMLSHVGGSVAPVLGFFVGVFAFLALVLSPLFAPSKEPRPPASPLSRMTSMERATRTNYE